MTLTNDNHSASALRDALSFRGAPISQTSTPPPHRHPLVSAQGDRRSYDRRFLGRDVQMTLIASALGLRCDYRKNERRIWPIQGSGCQIQIG